MDFYITPQEYEEAAKNGVDAFNLERRIRLLAWDKDKAINTPIRKLHKRGEWAKVAASNGIGYNTFMNRINNYGWDEEKAATEPLQDRKLQASKATEVIRKFPKKYVELAEKNGIPYHTFRARLIHGWDLYTAATKPKVSKKVAGQIGAKAVREKYGDWNRFSFK